MGPWKSRALAFGSFRVLLNGRFSIGFPIIPRASPHDARYSVRDSIWRRWWRFRVAILRLRGLRGDFEQGEVSARAAELTSRWMRRWPEFAPSPGGQTHVHSRYSGGYIRFHSLAHHGRGPFTGAEIAE